MPSLDEVLAKLSSQIPNDAIRSAILKEEFVEQLMTRRDFERREDALVFLETELLKIRKPTPLNDFTVQYNIYTDKVIFERALDVSKIERIAGTTVLVTEDLIEKRINELGPLGFEYLLVDLYSSQEGFTNIRPTPATKDKGIDLIGNYSFGGEDILVFGQAKHWQSRLPVSNIRDFIGAAEIESKGAKCMGIMACTGGFTSGALEAIHKSPIPIRHLDMGALVALLLGSSLGIKTKRLETYSIDEGYWDEVSCFDH